MQFLTFESFMSMSAVWFPSGIWRNQKKKQKLSFPVGNKNNNSIWSYHRLQVLAQTHEHEQKYTFFEFIRSAIQGGGDLKKPITVGEIKSTRRSTLQTNVFHLNLFIFTSLPSFLVCSFLISILLCKFILNWWVWVRFATCVCVWTTATSQTTYNEHCLPAKI